MIYKTIGKEVFKKLNCPEIKVDENSSCFAVLFNDKLKISWFGEFIKPQIENINNDLLILGANLKFIVYSLSESKIKFEINFQSFFSEFKILDQVIIIASQLDVYIIAKESFEILYQIPLMDFYDSMFFRNREIIIQTIDGNVISHPL